MESLSRTVKPSWWWQQGATSNSDYIWQSLAKCSCILAPSWREMAKGKFNTRTPKQYVNDPQTRETAVTCIDEAKDKNYQTEHFPRAKYSSLTKFLRVTAYLSRFTYNCRHSKSERRVGTFLVEEIEQARKFWVRSTQVKSFPQEVAALKSKQHVSSKSRLVSLSPISLWTGNCSCRWSNWESRHSILQSSPDTAITRSWVHPSYHHELPLETETWRSGPCQKWIKGSVPTIIPCACKVWNPPFSLPSKVRHFSLWKVILVHPCVFSLLRS